MFIEDDDDEEERKPRPKKLVEEVPFDPKLRKNQRLPKDEHEKKKSKVTNPTGKGGFQKGKVANPHGRGAGVRNYYNRLTNEERQVIAQAANGLTPLELFISVARSEDAPMDVRVEAAKAAAPYMHRKMPIAIEGGDPNKPINFLDIAQMKNLKSDELKSLLALLRKAGGQITGA